MVERVEAVPAWVLLRRAWRDSSQLLELLTREHGRVGAVVRGSRRRRGLDLLQRYRVSWQRRGELATLTQWEPDGAPIALSGEPVFWVWYANELVLRGLHRDDPHPGTFDAYVDFLAELQAGTADPAEAPLRRFEWRLLGDLGYRPSPPAEACARYRYDAEQGWEADADGPLPAAAVAAVLAGDLATPAACAAERALFAAHLPQWAGAQPLKTPAMLRALRTATGAVPNPSRDD